jgi:DNA-binding transcriptional LysR family regulator
MLRVGVPGTLPVQVPAELISDFTRQRPEVNVVRHSLTWAHYWTWLGVGQPLPGVDIVLAWLPPMPAGTLPTMTVGPVIRHEPRALLMGEHHPLAHRPTVDVEELADYDVLHPLKVKTDFADAWTPSATPAGRPIHRRNVDFDIPEQLHSVLDAGLLHVTVASIHESTIAFPGLVVVPLTGLPMFQLVTAWPAGTDSDLVHGFAKSAARSGARLWPTPQ